MKGLSEEDYEKLRRNIIKKLYAHNAFVEGHLLYERLATGIPSHLKGCVKEVLEELIKEGLVLQYGRTKHGVAYQLNIKQLAKIEKIISSAQP